MNYPWDTNSNTIADYAVAPDDALFKQMALVYSTPNSPMYNNNSFPFVHGTTNGDNWSSNQVDEPDGEWHQTTVSQDPPQWTTQTATRP